jgi:tetratricopeptide (TPR) repeat protein
MLALNLLALWLATLQPQAAASPDPDQLLQRALAYAGSGHLRAAIGAAERANALRPADLRIGLALARWYQQDGQDAAATLVLQELRDAHPREPLVRIELATLHHRRERGQEAMAELNALLQLDPNSAFGHYNLAVLLAAQGDNSQAAREHFQRALEIEPDSVDARFGLAALAADQDQQNEARALLQRCLDQQPSHVGALQLQAELQEKAGELEAATASWQRIAELDPRRASAFYALGRLRQKLGRTEPAKQAMLRFQELDREAEAREQRDKRVSATFKEAKAALEAAQTTEAAANFQRVLEIDPRHDLSRSYLAKIAYSAGDLTTAESDIQRAIESNPGEPEYHYLLALFLQKGKDRQAALREIELALELNPEDAESHNLRGNILVELGRPQEAAQAYRRALEIDPVNSSALLNLQALQ